MRAFRPLMILAALVLLLTGCGDDGTSDDADGAQAPTATSAGDGATADEATAEEAAEGGPTTVELVDFAIEAPDTAPSGEFVVQNSGDVPHTFTALDGTWDTGTIDPQGETTISIDSTGTFDYQCTLHPDRMNGTIEIS